MEYKRENTYLIVNNEPLTLRTTTSDNGLEITTLSPGSCIYCKSYTKDDFGDTWIRTNQGWIRATRGNEVFIK